MAKNVIINGNTYSNVPSVQIPLSGGGGNAIFYDTSDGDASANQIMSGYSAYSASGKIVGQLSVPTISQDGTTHVLSIA